jgi:hypothetical protein
MPSGSNVISGRRGADQLPGSAWYPMISGLPTTSRFPSFVRCRGAVAQSTATPDRRHSKPTDCNRTGYPNHRSRDHRRTSGADGVLLPADTAFRCWFLPALPASVRLHRSQLGSNPPLCVRHALCFACERLDSGSRDLITVRSVKDRSDHGVVGPIVREEPVTRQDPIASAVGVPFRECDHFPPPFGLGLQPGHWGPQALHFVMIVSFRRGHVVFHRV